MNPEVQIIGFGPATIGLFAAADRIGVLDDLLRRGVVIHEKAHGTAGWASLAYQIKSNSPVSDFLTGLRHDGLFGSELASPTIRRWMKTPNSSVDLMEMSAFLKTLMMRVLQRVESAHKCGVLWNSPVDTVQIAPDGFFAVRRGRASSNLFSTSLVLATGAANKPLPRGFEGVVDAVDGDCVLRGKADATLLGALRDGRTLLILGGSHSGFSSLGYLLDKFGAMLRDGQIYIVSRNSVLEMWDRNEAEGRILSDRDRVNPVTGEVNRFGGLRRKARQVYRDVAGGEEPKAVLRELAPGYDPLALLKSCSGANGQGPLVINATGYAPRVPTVLSASGDLRIIDVLNGNVAKCPLSGEIRSDGHRIHGLYGTGLGFADAGPDGPQVGINFFNTAAAQRIVEHFVGGRTVQARRRLDGHREPHRTRVTSGPL